MPQIIRSSSAEDNALPWFEYSIADDKVTFTKANGLSVATGKAPPQAEKGLLKTHTLTRSKDSTKDPSTGLAPKDEVHILAVALDGTLDFVPASHQKPVYYAHLAWQHPDGTWDRLEFIE